MAFDTLRGENVKQTMCIYYTGFSISYIASNTTFELLLYMYKGRDIIV